MHTQKHTVFVCVHASVEFPGITASCVQMSCAGGRARGAAVEARQKVLKHHIHAITYCIE
eukprot:82214-Pelagomonas_calceolata.AAC.1